MKSFRFIRARVGQIRSSSGEPSFRRGLYTTIVILGVVIALLLLNSTVSTVNWRLDLTASQMFSLDEGTLEILNELNEDVTVYVFFERGSENELVISALEEYERQSRRVQVVVADADEEPGLADSLIDNDDFTVGNRSVVIVSEAESRGLAVHELFQIRQDGEGRSRIVGVDIERQITSAILHVTSGESSLIYEVRGLGSASLEEHGLIDAVETGNNQLRTLNLVSQQSVPEDADAVVVLASERDLPQAFVEPLLDYIGRGGALFVAADFRLGVGSNLSEVLRAYGLSLERGVVFEGDRGRRATQPFDLLPESSDHVIASTITEEDTPFVFPLSMAISQNSVVPADIEIEPILFSSENSWLRRDIQESRPERLASDEDGPFNLAVAATGHGPDLSGRLVLTGSLAFLQPHQTLGRLPGNSDFVANSIAWLLDGDEMVSLRPRGLLRLPITISRQQQIIYAVLVVIVLPGFIFGSGVVMWLRRRHK